jgi:hypothetical protein
MSGPAMKMKLGQNRSTPAAVDAVLKPTGLTKRLQMNIPETLHKEFKKACLDEDVEMTDVVIKMLNDWLKAKKAKDEK